MELSTGVREKHLIQNRLMVAAIGGACLLILLVVRLIWLQLIETERFQTASEANRLQTLPVSPARGLIVDRNGLILAENRPNLQLLLVPEEVDDIDVMVSEVRSRIEFTDGDAERFAKNLKSRRRPRDPVVVKDDLSESEAALIAVDLFQFPGLQIEARPTRFYPYGGLTAHSLGYVGRLSLNELQAIEESRYAGTETIGKSGVEKAYEDALLGQVGVERVETSARGQIMRSVDRDDPVPGADIPLHLDIGLTAKLYEALGDRRGAIVAMDPQTGGILGLASAPTYDANAFIGGISQAEYAALQVNQDTPLFNRALRGQYPPGSTIKPMLGLVGLHYGAVTWEKEISDRGFFQLSGDDHKYRDWKKWGHGRVNIEKAVIESCDTYFYEMAVRLGVDQMSEGMRWFGFGRRQGRDIQGDLPGILPSREWKRQARNQSWYLGETVISGIGQGFWVTTPLQLAAATTAMARRGNFIEPHFSVLEDVDAGSPVPLGDSMDWERMIDAMEDVLHGERGTARGAARGLNYRIAGKTGTVQVVGIAQEEEYDANEVDERLRDHALFVGFAPADSPSIVLALVIENGGSGGTTAAPVARQVFDYWVLERNEGERAPDETYVSAMNQQVLGYGNADSN
ncbi:MAG TPA: penicillin-binding protein 2 [Gammaproteobacteria bacterium]|nr:penicillin-binding protein 2 [Litorivicinaceae bacterium]HAB69077.1 penicillin-binding protein 2 [Gammaproteobacteria bacterium]HAB78629.1 penicillin-binding protein 2 [Gammaproteobacteria bacterium]